MQLNGKLYLMSSYNNTILFGHSLIKKLYIFIGDSEAQNLGINIEKLKEQLF